MYMRPHYLRYHRSEGDFIFIMTNELPGYHWPKVYLFEGTYYHYEGNWPMPRELASECLGYARYKKENQVDFY